MKKALLVGYGGIAKAVYAPQLQKLGYEVEVVEPSVDYFHYQSVNDIPKNKEYEVAVICCPNQHHLNAVLEVSDVCKTILVEKPGLANTKAWTNTIHRFPDHNIFLVKNNLYRKNIETFETLIDFDEVAKVDINWMNRDRIPNPGTWFTTKEKAFGGVTHDLFPHLYCFMLALFPFEKFRYVTPQTFTMQRWNLDNIDKYTDYGFVNKNGTYDVCDYAEAHYLLPTGDDTKPLPITLRASWKEGYDDQAVHIYYKNGSKMTVEFGLCPDDAYGRMIEAAVNNQFMGNDRQTWEEHDFDKWVHMHLEWFD